MFEAVTRQENPKTQTRRIEASLATINQNPGDYKGPIPSIINADRKQHWIFHSQFFMDSILATSRYQKGDTVYLKEPTCIKEYSFDPLAAVVSYRYKKKEDSMTGISLQTAKKLKHWPYPYRWTSPLMMFEDFARYHITITDVRTQRLQDITHQDAIAEGFPNIEAFMQTIKTLHGEEVLDQNPYVFAYTFQLVNQS